MTSRAEFLNRQRREAWAFGRELRDRLLAEYQQRYGLQSLPPPARIIDELLTDFLNVDLRFDPLREDVFAQTEWINGRTVVTVNTLSGHIPGVKDAAGVDNVGKWHETIHIVRDLHVVRTAPTLMLPGFEAPPTVTCRRGLRRSLSPECAAREFWAEEAGRAAAVSFQALARSESFRELCEIASNVTGPVPGGFPLLYQAAKDIGVNITSLVKQLTLEGRIEVREESGRRTVHVQPSLTEFLVGEVT
jgi:hypothetical protein